MRNQDPLNPMDNAQVTSQMAQIYTVVGIDKLNATVQGLSGQFMQLQALQGQVGGYVNAAITSMQFQDMTSQLIDRTLKRVTGLREFLGTLGAHGAEMLPESDHEEIVALLGKVSMALAIQSLELRSVLRKAVSQQHLESGDIELF